MSLTLDQYTIQATGEGAAKLTFIVNVTRFPIDGLVSDEDVNAMLDELHAKVQEGAYWLSIEDANTVRRIYEHGVSI